MIAARHIGVDGWSDIPKLSYKRKVSIVQNLPNHDSQADINVLCLLESEMIVPTFPDDVLGRFDLILTWRDDIVERYPQARKFLYGTKWVNEFNEKKDKQNRISFLASSKRMVLGHLYRLQIFDSIQKIGSINGIPIDCVMTPPRIESKNSILDKYKFSIVMENHRKRNYFTEKIIDCFATNTIPIYWGCPNINEYFDDKGILSFTTFDTLHTILNSITENSYDDLIQSVEANFLEAKKYYSLWDRIDAEIDKFLEQK